MQPSIRGFGLVIKLILPLILAHAASVTAQSDSRGWYFHSDVGGTVEETARSRALPPPFPRRAAFTIFTGEPVFRFDPGMRFDTVFGYQLSQLATEFETGLIYNTARVSFYSTETDPYGEISRFVDTKKLDCYRVPVLLNLRYEPNLHSRFKPMVGFGVGGFVSTFQSPPPEKTFGGGGNKRIAPSDDLQFAYQGLAGVNYHVSKRIDLGIECKFLETVGDGKDFHPRGHLIASFQIALTVKL